MKVVVVGSGVVGTTSAWYLCKAGHDVTVVDRRSSPAMETSFGNAGQISPGYSSPWAAPGIPLKALRWLLMEHAPLIMRNPDLAMLRWLAVMLRNCTAGHYALNKRRMVRLAEFSRDCLVELREETAIGYDNLALGSLQLFRKQNQLDDIAKDVAVLNQDGVAFEVLDAAGCMKREPGLANSAASIAGGLLLPNDETGDCYKFTNELAREARRRGVTFCNDTPVRRLVPDGRQVHVECDQASISADAVLLAAGSYSPFLARPLGIRLPIYPVKGYSITAAITEPTRAPVSTVIDESYKIAITRLGDRVRVGGMAELSGYNDLLPQRRRVTLERCVGSLFPGVSDLASATFWTGLRPMTPDGTPIVGATSVPNVFLNTGHGTLGWTMACGSGRVIADIISGRSPEIETGDLAVGRYR